MFEKRKLEPARVVLHDSFRGFPRALGCTVSSGFYKNGKKYTEAYVKTTKITKQFAEEIGRNGAVETTYALDGTLTVKLSFSYDKDSDEYEIVKDVFFDNEEDIDVDPDYPEENYQLHFKTYTDEPLMEFIYTYTNIKVSEIPI